jgi:hypothetical protein
MILKPFNQQLFDENDPESREIVRELYMWFNKSTKIIDNPNRYGVDLLQYNLIGKPYRAIEVERRSWWRGERFPFDTIHIPTRKIKYVQESRELGFPMLEYACVNDDLTWVMLFDMYSIEEYPTIKMDAPHRPPGEPFYDIPVKNWLKICFDIMQT